MKKFITGTIIFGIIGIVIWILVFNFLYPLKYQSQIKAAGLKYEIDPVLIAAIINTESSFDNHKVSPKSAVGLMQILPSTAAYITKKDAKMIDLYDPNTNIEIGTKYLHYLMQKFNDLDTALFAYNAGEGNVTKWLQEQQVTTLQHCPFPETNTYVQKVKRTMKYYRGRI